MLYVEDNLSNVQLIKRLLAHRPGVRLLPVMQGRLALDLASQHNPDLILLDLQLPDIPGDEVLRRLRETPETRHIPVIVISADATPGQTERLRTAGAWQYLTKPLDVKKFLSLLDEALKGRDADPAGVSSKI
ncbi:MAG TPA: response regulator [bacterium]